MNCSVAVQPRHVFIRVGRWLFGRSLLRFIALLIRRRHFAVRIIVRRVEVDSAVVGDVVAYSVIGSVSGRFDRDGVLAEREQTLVAQGDKQRQNQQHGERSETPLLPHVMNLPFT